LLARQSLLERARGRLPRVLERMGGLQAQYAPSMYIGLWSRVEGFARDDLTKSLVRRTVVQGTLMRSTIHLVSAGDYWPVAVAVRQARRNWWLRATRTTVAPEDVAEQARVLRERLRDGPLRRDEIERIVGKGAITAVGMWLDMVRVPPAGTWERRRADLYAAAEDWIGPCDATKEAAIEHLVRRYLGGFGPATARDIVVFTGIPAPDIAQALEGVELRRFRDDAGATLYDLPRAPLPDDGTPAGVRFLPTWDAALLVHARRTQILPEEYRPLIFHTKIPQSLPTFLVDGAVAGTWKYEQGRIRLDPFRPLDRAIMRDLDEEAGRLAAMHA
jgi:hypothetical protein